MIISGESIQPFGYISKHSQEFRQRCKSNPEFIFFRRGRNDIG